MKKSLDLYKSFIDGLASLSKGVYENWIMEKGAWPDFPDENKGINNLLLKLNIEEKRILVNQLEQARDGGIHDTLVYLSDKISLDGLKLIENENEIPYEPFGTEMYYDWLSRREGDKWPE